MTLRTRKSSETGERCESSHVENVQLKNGIVRTVLALKHRIIQLLARHPLDSSVATS